MTKKLDLMDDFELVALMTHHVDMLRGMVMSMATDEPAPREIIEVSMGRILELVDFFHAEDDPMDSDVATETVQ